MRYGGRAVIYIAILLSCHHASPVQPPFQEGQHILANQLVEAGTVC